MVISNQSKHDWQTNLNPTLLARLTRPQNRSGIVKPSWARQIQRRLKGTAISSQTLANTLLQRQTQHSTDAVTLPPLVYPQRLEPSLVMGIGQPKSEASFDMENSTLRRAVATRPVVNRAMPPMSLRPPAVDSSPSLLAIEPANNRPAPRNSPVTTPKALVQSTVSRPVVQPQISSLSSVLRRAPQSGRPSIQTPSPTVQPMNNPVLSSLPDPGSKQPIVQIPAAPQPTAATSIPTAKNSLPPSLPATVSVAKPSQTANVPLVQASFAPEIAPQAIPLVYAPIVSPVERPQASEIQRSLLPAEQLSDVGSSYPQQDFQETELVTAPPAPVAPPPQLPLVDEVVDQALRKLSRRLAVEQERQGGQPWF